MILHPLEAAGNLISTVTAAGAAVVWKIELHIAVNVFRYRSVCSQLTIRYSSHADLWPLQRDLASMSPMTPMPPIADVADVADAADVANVADVVDVIK